MREFDPPRHGRSLLTSGSRGLHSTLFALVGAIGFLASALLPAESYTVSYFPLSRHILHALILMLLNSNVMAV